MSAESGGWPTAGDTASLDATSDRPVEDAELVRRALIDAEAFGLLYERYCDRIFRFVRRRLPDPGAAEDVTAEVFFKALRALDSYRPQTAPFSAWLYRIAANAATDQLRVMVVTAPLEAALDVPDPAEPVADQVARRLEADRVWSAVDQLGDAQRLAATLRWGHDLPVAEIASRMGRSEGAVRLLLNRGLRAIRTHLQTPTANEVHPAEEGTA